jgi:hypothetical protein
MRIPWECFAVQVRFDYQITNRVPLHRRGLNVSGLGTSLLGFIRKLGTSMLLKITTSLPVCKSQKRRPIADQTVRLCPFRFLTASRRSFLSPFSWTFLVVRFGETRFSSRNLGSRFYVALANGLLPTIFIPSVVTCVSADGVLLQNLPLG